ncbi:ubiquitin-conjugating enzyme E2 [Aspergillus ibericus CBS 121593]|uniref:Ubiquitin conjugating enzyme n=1 Tax=Aspergillus ibericus CBS 121593 TaxID=1448316 RepID=A0A395GRS9_9EURO|nr:ubiquitin conjugating enzyme [Aspergillus ibericus CBS 121593]RAK98271.1 ubiquitin conjugating enzyme [Aspergillus ibericus CBS 121593]
MDATGGTPGVPNAQFARATKFELEDSCCLKSNHSLVGVVQKTHHDINSHEPPDDYLVVSYTSVPAEALAAFLETGVPPKGYVFVGFVEFAQGYSLIHEDDLLLIDRPVEIGEDVKRHPDDTMSGMVIDASATCTLEPIAFRTYNPSIGDFDSLEFTEDSRGYETDIPPPQLHDVPVSELVNHEEFSEGDYIIHRQKLGIIREVERDAILRVSDMPVWVVNPNVLEIPVRFDDKGLVWMPRDQISRDVGMEMRFLEYDFVYPGQYVFTQTGNMRRVDGSSLYGLDVDTKGYVLATPATEYRVEWLCMNVFSLGMPYTAERLELLRASSLHGHAVKCDFGKVPAGGAIKSDVWLDIGDRVRFRDPAAAAQKYPAHRPIPTDESFGYDLNVFRIVSSKTKLTVQWQDGSITTEDSRSVHRFYGFDAEIGPGNIVALKDGLEEIQRPPVDSMPSFTKRLRDRKKETMRARTVGVVQTVDSRERVATVRWYKDPDVELLHGGQMLRACSSLGELGDTISQVSLYELNVFPGLDRIPGDIVLLAPDTIHQSGLEVPDMGGFGVAGPCNFSYTASLSFFQMYTYLEAMRMEILHSPWFQKTTRLNTTPLPPRYGLHQNGSSARFSTDFIGQIISTSITGDITVRILGGNECRDVRVPFERIMMVIDEDEANPATFPSPTELSPMEAASLFDLPDDMQHTTTYEYEGGERLDDGGEDQWMTDDTDDSSDFEGADLAGQIASAPYVEEIELSEDSGDEMGDDDSDEDMDAVVDETGPPAPGTTQPSPLTAPPGFHILEGLPPSDHHFIAEEATGNTGPRIKRIRKEFEILSKSLPPGIFVRTWESRMDLLRVLIIGPEGTPYEYAPIVIDVHFSNNFPNQPPATFFHSWTNGQGRINPNLYEDGKICLSILGTWPTRDPEENWSPIKSTVLQILVSIMGLVLVKDPFYNEAGYEALAAEGNRRVESSQYTEKTFLMTRKFIKHALEQPVVGMEDVVAWNYLAIPADSSDNNRPVLLRRAIEAALAMIEHYNSSTSGDGSSASAFVSRLSLGAVVMLRKHVTDLEKLEAATTAPGQS